MRDLTRPLLFRLNGHARTTRGGISSSPVPSRPWLTIVRAVQRSWAFTNLLSRTQRRRSAEARLLADSSLFDREWYLRTYPDVAAAGVDALRHYLTSGWREGRDPGPEFATSAYLQANPDVARSGANPLLHYIEFGYVEGRNSFGHRPPFKDGNRAAFDFAEVDPPLSFPPDEAAPPAWLRAYRIDPAHADSVVIGGVAVACSHGSVDRNAVADAALSWQILSGSDAISSAGATFELPQSTHQMIDAWYLNAVQLRTRWQCGQSPFAIRALQYDPADGGIISLVADSLVSSPLDIIDLQLRNAFFPVLVIFCEPDGRLLGCRLLAFPSLCRGGCHYPELLAAARSDSNGSIDILALSDRLASQLLRLKAGVIGAAVAQIDVDVTQTDGTGGVFRPDFRRWLEQVMCISIAAATRAPDCLSGRFLERTVKLDAAPGIAREGMRLRLASDMIPTIGALTEPLAEASKADSEILVPLLVADPDPGRPGTLIALPPAIAPLLRAASAPGSVPWPSLLAAKGRLDSERFPPAAIRLLEDRPLGSAELIVPVALDDSSFRPTPRPPVTWLIDTRGWQARDLGLAIQCIALQHGGSADQVAFVGDLDRATLAMADDLFGQRVSRFGDATLAIESLDTPLAGFVGAAVLLHDIRWADVAATMLADEAVSSASSVMVRTEQRGGRWHCGEIDTGLEAGDAQLAGDPGESNIVRGLWRSTFPVAAPPDSLWLTTSAKLRKWHKSEEPNGAAGLLHLCSFAVTASHAGGEVAGRRAVSVPRAAPENVTKLRVIYG